jgi:tetratricopeptide (TPR) repeat protein
MGIDEIRELIDRLYEQGQSARAEEVLISTAGAAAEEGDDYLLLQILNELIGHYRETGEWEKAFEIADRSVMVAGYVFPKESVPYATTLLNVASMYRAAGKLTESRSVYHEVEQIYAVTLKADDMLYASLYNNEALLCQEEGEFAKAKALLLKALDIDRANGREYEEAVSLANIAATMMRTGEEEGALKAAESSIALFESLGVKDQHLCAAFSAMGSYYFMKGKFDAAATCFKQGCDIMESVLGRNGYYERLLENYNACIAAMKNNSASAKKDNAHVAKSDTPGAVVNNTSASAQMTGAEHDEKKNGNSVTNASRESAGGKGLDISRKYYEKYVRPMIDERFPEYASKIACGLAGEGSDAFGYDDELSRDHDWGPSVCLWITEETDKAIGEDLRKAYEELPDEIDGIKRALYVQGKSRRGVQVISSFFERLTGASEYEKIDWRNTESFHLAAAVNGEIWRDDEGIVTAFREKLMNGYPEEILLLNLAEGCARFSREGQYNAQRVLERGDELTSKMFIYDAAREAMKLQYLLNGKFYPHDKWLRKGLAELEGGAELDALLQRMTSNISAAEDVGAFLAMEMYRKHYISDVDPYLDHQTEELLQKSLWSTESIQDLAMKIARLEFEAFDKVSNEGGRASCQDDWPTFSTMRRSQYLTWNKTMLLQYIYDFEREMKLGHNLITEKYGRMMESTAPERYAEIRDNFPVLTDEKKAIIDQIAQIQVKWMEEVAEKYPAMGARARRIHTYEDYAYDTSYETYLRGELGTYSDKMLELYAGFIVELSSQGRNLAYETMQNTARLYGYDSLESAERFMAR